MSELKPCPFCGGKADPSGWMNGYGQQGPECETCGATAQCEGYWNRRVQPEAAPEIGTRYRNDAGEVVAVVVPPMASHEMREAGMHPLPVRAGHGHFQANMYLAMLAALPEPGDPS